MIQNILCKSYVPSNFTTGKGREILHERVKRSSMEEKDMDAWEYGDNSKAQEWDSEKRLFPMPHSLIFS